MKNLEQILKNLPKAKLSFQADQKIKFRLKILIWKKRLSSMDITGAFTVRRLVPISLVIIFLVIATIPAYAYESPSVTYGHILYPVKRIIENVEVGLNKSEVAQVKVYEKLAARRLSEAEYLSKTNDEKNNDNLAKTLSEAMTTGKRAVEISKNASSSQSAKAVDDIIELSRKTQTEVLSKVAQNVGIKADEKIVDAISLGFDNLAGNFFHVNKKIKSNDSFKNASSSISDATGSTSTLNTDNFDEEMIGQESTTTGIARDESIRADRNKKFSGEKINKAKKNIENLLKNLKSEDVTNDEMNTLQSKLNTKIENAQKAMAEGDIKKVDSIINESSALTKNAKYFIKAKKQAIPDFKSINKINNKIKENTSTSTKIEEGKNIISTSTDQSSEDKSKKENKFFKFFRR